MSEVRGELFLVEVKPSMGAKRWERYQVVTSKKQALAWVKLAHKSGHFIDARFSRWVKA